MLFCNLLREITIASIPFCRNIAEFSGDEHNFLKLTSLLHYKPDTDSIKMKDLETIIKEILKDKSNLSLPSAHKSVTTIIFDCAKEITADNSDKLDLEKKICLSMAIRLKAEIFVVKKINDTPFWTAITKNQSNALLEKYKSTFSNENLKIKLLEQVNLMTPENIHFNSFMYEPIIDMSNHHLKTLYKEISELT